MRRLAAAGLALVATCASAAEPKTFRSDEWGLMLTYPADLAASDHFKPNFFDRGAWRVSYAAGTGPGEPIVAVSLPDLRVVDAGGESTATAELRIGASRDPDIVATCLTYGLNSGNNVETTSRTIGGLVFTEVPDNSDGEAMRKIASDDFRAVHKGACYAIDLVTFVGGTANRPETHSPADLARLRRVVDSIQFTR